MSRPPPAASFFFGRRPFAAFASAVVDELDRALHLRRAFNSCGVCGFTSQVVLFELEAEYRLSAGHCAGDLVLAQRAGVSPGECFAFLVENESRVAVAARIQVN